MHAVTTLTEPHRAPAASTPAAPAIRRFEMLPTNGAGSIHTAFGARGQGSAFSPAGLTELISSIARHGMLQPLLVEELRIDGVPSRSLVAGERRLRACRIGMIDNPDNPHFQRVPALITTGPLSGDERSAWSICENLSREDLPPGRLGAALLNARADLLLAALQAAGITAPAIETEDPIERWNAADRFRAQHAGHLCAPWASVLRELGISFGPRKARLLVAAFKSLPIEVSTDMDAHQIALVTRTKLVKAAQGQGEFAEEIWAAVKTMGRPELLAATSTAITSGKPLEQALTQASAIHDDANEARRIANTPTRPHEHAHAEAAERPDALDSHPPPIDADPAIAELRSLLEQLQSGARLERYTAGTLHLLISQLQHAIAATR